MIIRHPGLEVRPHFGAFLERESEIRPDARMAHNRQLMTANAPLPPIYWWQEFEQEMAS